MTPIATVSDRRFDLRAVLLLAALASGLLAGCGDGEMPREPAPEEKEIPWTPLVSGDAIFDRVKKICEIGPRYPESPGSEQARGEIIAQLAESGIKVSDIHQQVFTMPTPEPETDGDTEFTNVIAVLPGKKKEGVAIAAHYDSKIFIGMEFIGANDAASACGAVIEIARYLVDEEKKRGEPAEWSTYFVFFDGEEAIKNGWNDAPGHHTYGSRHLANNMDDYPFQVLVLLDMIGTENIGLANDRANSDAGLIGIFKETSRRVFGYDMLYREIPVTDDHVSFKGKIPAIDLIDAQFEQRPWWHTAEDTLDIVKPRALEKVATLVLHALPEIGTRYVH